MRADEEVPPIVPISGRMAALIDANGQAFYLSVGSVRKAFFALQDELNLPPDGESWMKLIRRSMAHLARQRLGERDWVKGMLGHKKVTTSDTYALLDTGYLGRTLGSPTLSSTRSSGFAQTRLPCSMP